MRTLTLAATLLGAASLSAQAVTNYGSGCGATAKATFYETFANGQFDLANTSIRMTPNWNGGYDVTPGSNTWVTPTSPSLGLSDDQVSGPLALGAPFFYPGGSTTEVYMNSNGLLYLEPGGGTACCNTTLAAVTGLLLGGEARIAPFWVDLDPGAAGTTHFEVIGGCAYITWVDVPQWQFTTGNSFQICLQPTGIVEITYGNMDTNSQPANLAVTGFSPGNGALDPGEIDLTTALLLHFSTSTDVQPLALDMAGACPPFLGTSVNLVTSNVPTGSLITATALSFQQFNPGLPLAGTTGCEQYIGAMGAVTYILSGSPTATATFDIPSNAFYAGSIVKAQSACLVPGFNPLGAITSNGTAMTLTVIPPVQATENFEGTITGVGNYPTGWSDGGGIAMWSSDDSGTPSAATGPTAAVSGTQYMYCETSGSNGTATFAMNSAVYPNTGLSVLDIQLSRVGASIGTLEVRLGDGSGTFPTVIGTFTGPNAAAEWVNELICFSSTATNVQFQFFYTAGGSFTGDIAIDDVSVR